MERRLQPGEASRRLVLTARSKFLLLALMATVVVSRAPALLSSPRFWGDEGRTYFAYAWQNGLLPSLLFVSTGFACYFNFAINVVTSFAAHYLPLECAPIATTGAALVIQLTVFAVVLFGRSRLWTGDTQRLVACLIFLFGPPVTQVEVWLNMTNAQVFCGILGIILLLEVDESRSSRALTLNRSLLVLCGLSGPYTAMLTPAYVVKAYLLRSREARLQGWIVAFATVAQVAVYTFTRLSFPFTPDRMATGRWSWRIVTTTYHHLVFAVLGYDLSPRIGSAVGIVRSTQPGPDTVGDQWWLAVICIAVMVLILVGLVVRAQRPLNLVILTAFLSVVVSTAFLAMDPSTSRYSVVSGTLFILVIFTGAVDPTFKWRRTVCRIILTMALMTGAAAFWRDLPPEFSPLGRAPGRPDWVQEVRVWRRDSSHALKIWPYTDENPAWMTLLEGADSGGSPVRFDRFDLVTRNGVVSHRVDVDGLTTHSRMNFRIESSQPSDPGSVSIALVDGRGAILRKHPLRQLPQHSRQWYGIGSWSLLGHGRVSHSDVRGIVFTLKSQGTLPQLVTVDELRIVPFFEGGLEPLLGVNSVRFATPGMPTDRTYSMMVESLRLDRDVVFDSADRARAVLLWPTGRHSVRLLEEAGRWVYRRSPLEGFVSLPVQAFSGAPRLSAVALHLTFALAVLAIVKLGATSQRAVICVALFFCAPPMLETCADAPLDVVVGVLLFVPAALWLAGALTGSGARWLPFAAGLLVGSASVHFLAAIGVGLVIAADMARSRRGCQIACLALGLVVAAACLVSTDSLSGSGSSLTFRWQEGNSPELGVRESAVVGRPEETPEVISLPGAVWRLAINPKSGLVAFPLTFLAALLYVAHARDQRRDLLFAAITVLFFAVAWSTTRVSVAPLTVATFYPLFFLLVPDWTRRHTVSAAVVLTAVSALLVIDRLGPAPWVHGPGRERAPRPAVSRELYTRVASR